MGASQAILYEGDLPPQRGDDSPTDDDVKIPLNAMSGTCTGEIMPLAITMHDQTLIVLADSSSTHCYMVAYVVHPETHSQGQQHDSGGH
jgi:hypothetical protein